MQLLSPLRPAGPPVEPSPAPQPAPTTAVPPTLSDRWAVAVLVALLGVCTTIVASKSFDTDAWWHLRTGKLILAEGAIPSRDAFSWSAQGEPLRLFSWLFDVLVGTLHQHGGRTLLVVLVLACTFGFGLVCYWWARREGSRRWPAVAAITLVMPVFLTYVAERPQMLSYLLFVSALAIADRALRGSNRALVGLAAVVALWSNFHLAFSIAVGTIGLIAVARVIQGHPWRRSALVVATAVAAGLVNPLAFEAYTASPDTRRVSVIINEWQPVSLTQPRDGYMLLLVALAVLFLVRTGRWRRLDVMFPLVAVTVLWFDAVRNGPFLLVLLAPELAAGFSALALTRLRAWARPRARPLVHGVVIGLGVGLAFWAPSALAHARPVTGDVYPIESTAAIPAGCRLLNEYDFGGYVIAHRWPDVTVSQDGRNNLYGEHLLIEQLRVLEDKHGALAWLDRHGVDCALIRPERPLADHLRHEGWTVRGRDPGAVLFVRPRQ